MEIPQRPLISPRCEQRPLFFSLILPPPGCPQDPTAGRPRLQGAPTPSLPFPSTGGDARPRQHLPAHRRLRAVGGSEPLRRAGRSFQRRGREQRRETSSRRSSELETHPSPPRRYGRELKSGGATLEPGRERRGGAGCSWGSAAEESGEEPAGSGSGGVSNTSLPWLAKEKSS